MATAAFKGESPFNGILEREHHESDFKWVFERNKKLFEIPGISGTQITSTQRAAPLEWYFSFLTHQCSVSIKIWIVLSVFFLLDFIPYSSLHYRLCPSLKWILHFSIAGKWLHYYITRSRSLCWSRARGEHPFGKHLSQVQICAPMPCSAQTVRPDAHNRLHNSSAQNLDAHNSLHNPLLKQCSCTIQSVAQQGIPLGRSSLPFFDWTFFNVYHSRHIATMYHLIFYQNNMTLDCLTISFYYSFWN